MSSVTNSAFRESVRVDLTRIRPWGGALRALPVVALVTFGLGIGSARTALTLGVGANLVAVVSLVGSSRVAMSVVQFDVVGLGCATFVGAATAFNTPLHLGVLAIWCIFAGMLVAFGLGPATAGVQSVVAFVVFGRFSDGPAAAASLGALVASGAAIEGLALLALRLPASAREQRAKLGLAYERLSSLTEEVGPNAVEVAADLEIAAQLLTHRTTVEGGQVAELQSLIDEARRIRLELIAIAGLRRRLEAEADPEVLRATGKVLRAVNREISALSVDLRSHAGTGSAHSTESEGELERDLGEFRVVLEASLPDEPLSKQLLTHLDALAGQLRAATTLLASANHADRVRGARLQTPWQLPTTRALGAVASSTATIFRESLTLSSSAFRHALRLAVAVPGAQLVATALDLPRSYWVAFTVAVVLKPDYSSLFRRGLSRVVGTILGATLAALIVGGFHPGTAATVLLVALCALAAYSLWQASFAVGIGFVTALVLFLLATTQVDTLSTATDRLIDTVLGGAIALGVYMAWPTWSSSDSYEALANLIESERCYLGTLFAAMQGDLAAATQFSARTRAVRLAFGSCEAAIARAADEPRRHRFDDAFGRRVLAASQRVAQAAHSLRSELERGLLIVPLPALQNLATSIDRALASIRAELGGASEHESFPLRAQFQLASTALAQRGDSGVIALQLDEIVDAVNSIEAIVIDHDEQAGTRPA